MIKRPAPKSSSATLKAAIVSLEATSAQLATLAELRAWRIKMAKQLIRPSAPSTKGKK